MDTAYNIVDSENPLCKTEIHYTEHSENALFIAAFQNAAKKSQEGSSMKKKPAEDRSGPSAEDVSRHVCRRIHELRQQRGWSLDVLSKASGVSRSMLSQIEREQANPTLAVTVKIAVALGMSVAELLEQVVPVQNIEMMRAEDRSAIFRADANCSIRTLSPLHLEKDVEFYEVLLHPEGALKSAAHFEGTREFLTVQKGRISVTSEDQVVELNKSDSATYRADVPHEIRNLSRSESVVFLVVIYQ
jgi:transcriptional regulator with XRE-family HTH domain